MAPHDDEAGGQEWRPGERKGGHVTGPGQLQRSQSVVHDERAPQSTLDGLAAESASAGQCNVGAEAVVVECNKLMSDGCVLYGTDKCGRCCEGANLIYYFVVI